MNDPNFTLAFTAHASPDAVFAAITNVRGWWSEEIEGRTDAIGAEFTYRYQDVHRCTMKITELVPGRRVVWRCLANYFSFTRDETEWTGTDVVFDIGRKGDKTELRFTHEGLVPEYECYEACHQGWSTYIGESLRSLIETGKGQPNVGEPMTEKERALTA